jgi:hypothetical protein
MRDRFNTIVGGMRLGAKRWIQPIIVVAALALFYTTVGDTRAAAAVYWGSGVGAGAANLDGTNPQSDYFFWPYVNESAGSPCGVAVNSEYLYWAGSGGIGRRRLDGEGSQLKELGELKSQGILTEEEFAAQKAKLLG